MDKPRDMDSKLMFMYIASDEENGDLQVEFIDAKDIAHALQKVAGRIHEDAYTVTVMGPCDERGHPLPKKLEGLQKNN